MQDEEIFRDLACDVGRGGVQIVVKSGQCPKEMNCLCFATAACNIQQHDTRGVS